jgi:hypothetical protein
VIAQDMQADLLETIAGVEPRAAALLEAIGEDVAVFAGIALALRVVVPSGLDLT